jgi:putative ATPase
VVRLRPLRDDELLVLLRRAVEDPERGLGGLGVDLPAEAAEHLVAIAGGDARVALSALEVAAAATAPDASGLRRLTLAAVEEAAAKRAVRHDRAGDQHYDTVSAFIKSVRGSDPDAALFWMARMLEAGEDPRFIARRMVIHAAEDVGLADPRALLVATAAAQAVEFVGLPEARIPMAEAALYIALAPKSNAVCRAIDAAGKDARERAGPVPAHLRDASYRGGADLGHGRDYRYPHEYPEHWVAQQYLPDDLVGTRYYRPSESGEEPSQAQGKPGAGR